MGWEVLSGAMLFSRRFSLAALMSPKTGGWGGAEASSRHRPVLEARANSRINVATHVPPLCHNDLLPPNVLAESQRIWIVGLEYAGMCTRLFDFFAGFSVIAVYSHEQDARFLESYRGRALSGT